MRLHRIPRPSAIAANRARSAVPVFVQSGSQKPFEHSEIGTSDVHYLRPARRSRDERDRVAANAERACDRGQGGRRSPAIDGTLADPDDQCAIVLAAYARMGRAGPDP